MMTESVFVHVEGIHRPFTISTELLGRIKMQRDMEVVRKVLRAIQARTDLTPQELEVDGLDDFTVNYHVGLLHDAGYIDGLVRKSGSNFDKTVMVKDLTWAGHEFAGSILTDDSTWEKIKTAIGPEKLVKLPLKVLQDIATKTLTDWGLDQVHRLIS